MEKFIEDNRAALTGLFSKFGIDAPVTKENVSNALKAFPEMANVIRNTFDGFDSSGDSNNDEDNFERVTGKTKAEKDAKKAKRKETFKKLVNTGQTILSKANEMKNKNTPTENPVTEPTTKAEPKKILGVNSWLFWSVLVIVLLIIIFIVVKQIK